MNIIHSMKISPAKEHGFSLIFFIGFMNKTMKQLRNTLISFQRKTDQFFEQVLKKHSTQMSCQKKCSMCCHQQFSVFSWEAWLIEAWFKELSQETQALIKAQWKNLNKSSIDENLSPCAFLYDDQCSIYESRPVICRTQGLALKLSHEKMDWCPLNFQKEIPEAGDVLNLETLNTISATLQKFWEKEFPNSSSKRVTLAELKEKLLKI